VLTLSKIQPLTLLCFASRKFSRISAEYQLKNIWLAETQPKKWSAGVLLQNNSAQGSTSIDCHLVVGSAVWLAG